MDLSWDRPGFQWSITCLPDMSLLDMEMQVKSCMNSSRYDGGPWWRGKGIGEKRGGCGEPERWGGGHSRFPAQVFALLHNTRKNLWAIEGHQGRELSLDLLIEWWPWALLLWCDPETTNQIFNLLNSSQFLKIFILSLPWALILNRGPSFPYIQLTWLFSAFLTEHEGCAIVKGRFLRWKPLCTHIITVQDAHNRQ